jgi:peptidoglycan/LPS O-acetylase OafA/YrhL
VPFPNLENRGQEPYTTKPEQVKRGLPPHIRQLDALRGLAVLAVILYHYFPALFKSTPLGWIGVRFFFVLSGFLITGILLRAREAVFEGTEGTWFVLRRFYIRRFLRIFPIYYLVLLVLAALNADEIRDSLLWHLGYLSNVRFVMDGYFQLWVAHFWTLSVEEQFYLIWPAIILLIPRICLVPAIIFGIFVGPLYRLISQIYGFPGLACEVLLPASFDTLAVGALLAILLHRRTTLILSLKTWAMIAWAGALLFTALNILDCRGQAGIYRFAAGDFVFAIFAAALLHPLVRIAMGRLSSSGSWHLSVMSLTALELVITFLLAAVSWRFFEKPINDLKRFFPCERRESKMVAPVFQESSRSS